MLFALTLAVSARSVVFTTSTNRKIYYLLGGEVNPVMKFVDGKLVVNADQYEFSKIKNFYISETDDPTGIESTLASKPSFSYKSNQIVIETANADAVKVYSTSGAVVDATVNVIDGFVTIDLSSLPKGIYMVSVDGESFKVMKK